MFDMNRVTLSGYVCKPPIIQAVNENGDPSVVTFDIGHNKYNYKIHGYESEFFHCMALGTTARRLIYGDKNGEKVKASDYVTLDGKLSLLRNEKNGLTYENLRIMVYDYVVFAKTKSA